MKNDRMFHMLYLLMENERIPAPELAKRLEVSERTIYRYVESMSMADVPIYSVQGKNRGISLLPGYSFDKAMFSEEEQKQFIFGLQSLQAVNQQVDGLMDKLCAAFQKPKSDWIAVDFSRWGLQHSDTERFELLKNAILGKQVIEITYCGTSGETTSRHVHPLRLVYKDKNWYLQAYCLRADDFRLFKMGSIVELSLTGEVFATDYVKDIPPIEAGQLPFPTMPLRLRFPQRIAFRVYDEFNKESITRESDGYLLVDIAFPIDNWVVGYLFSFGTEVEILEPVHLKTQLAEYAKKIALHYKT